MIEIIAIMAAELCYPKPDPQACENQFYKCVAESTLDISETLLDHCTQETFKYLREGEE